MRPIAPLPDVRQSLVAAFNNCPLSTLFALQSEQRQPSWLAARGTLGHRFFADALRHMVRHGEARIDVEIAMELLQETIAQRDVPDEEVVHLPMSELKWLRVLATKFAYRHSYSIDRVVAVEGVDPWEDPGPGRHALTAEIPCRAGQGEVYSRTISGQIDVLLSDGPRSAVVVDYKTGWAPAPKKYEKGQSEEDQGDDTLSDMGYAQQVVYGFLVMANYPAVEQVTLREDYVMSDEVRESTIHRWEMERIQDVLAAIVSQFDAAVDSQVALELSRAEATPEELEKLPEFSGRFFPVAGHHCGFCPRKIDCPIREEVGIPATYEEAQDVIKEWIVAGEVRKDRLKMAKSWVDAYGPVEIRHAKGRLAAGWVTNSTGNGRSFRLYQPEDAAPSPFDPLLAAAARERGVLVREEEK